MINFAEFTRTPFLQNTTRCLLLIKAISIVFVMIGELDSESLNYDTKPLTNLSHKRNLLRRTLQVKQQISEAVVRRL